jgi:uncharacterized SAM-binding protein YcdF (DUF218 family)
MSRWKWSLALLATAAVSVFCLTRSSVLRAAGAWLDVGRGPEKADYIMLLNGELDTRTFAAAALLKGGWAPRLLLSDVAPSEQVQQGLVMPWRDTNRRVLNYCGVADGQIVILDHKARTTFDEAAALADFLAASPGSRVLLVTDGPHTRRARWIFTRLLHGRHKLTVVSAPLGFNWTDNWWQNEATCLFVLGEYFKLIFYGVRYGSAGDITAGLAAIILVLWFYRRRENTARQAKADASHHQLVV